MGFRINTNVVALSSHATGAANNRNIGESLEKLSSGLRINKAADDASGLAIANSLRSQANTLGQSIKNANDGIGIMQTADKAIDEQSKILDTIKTKATQAAQDGQTEDTRKAIQKDITKLMEELDNIAETTSFNGQSLLSGQYTDKKFQIGANANETISLDINATSSDKIGHTRFETGHNIDQAYTVSALKFVDVDGMKDVTLESVVISHSAGTGIGVMAETINKQSEQLGVKASWTLTTTGDGVIASGGTADVTDLTINGIQIGTISAVEANDRDGRLVNAINEQTDKTGVIASVDERGRLELKSTDGRGISLSGTSVDTMSNMGIATADAQNYGRLTLIKLDGTDIVLSNGGSMSKIGMDTMSGGTAALGSQATINLRDIKRGFTLEQADAMGMFTNEHDVKYSKASDVKTAMNSTISDNTPAIGAGVTTLEGAMAVMSIADAAVKDLDEIRSEIGSTQNQMVSTINNISVTQVNVKAAESQIRDVDFAEESANFQKMNLLAQAGSYVAGQANTQQQGVMQLLR
jgi:flagellin